MVENKKKLKSSGGLESALERGSMRANSIKKKNTSKNHTNLQASHDEGGGKRSGTGGSPSLGRAAAAVHE